MVTWPIHRRIEWISRQVHWVSLNVVCWSSCNQWSVYEVEENPNRKGKNPAVYNDSDDHRPSLSLSMLCSRRKNSLISSIESDIWKSNQTKSTLLRKDVWRKLSEHETDRLIWRIYLSSVLWFSNSTNPRPSNRGSKQSIRSKAFFKIASIYSKHIDSERKHFLRLCSEENIDWTRTNGLSDVVRELWNVDDRSVPFHVFSKTRQSETGDSFVISRPTSAISFEISCLYSLRLPSAVICSRNCFRSSISSNTRWRTIKSVLWPSESRSHTFVESIQFTWGSGRPFTTLSRNSSWINTVSHQVR